MFSYYESGIKKTYNGLEISINTLKSLIKANPYAEQINRLRKIEYGSVEYKKYKTDTPWPCCKPHGVFKNIGGTEVLQKLSGYLYFDVDNSKIPEEYKNDIEGYKEVVIEKHSDIISTLGKSIGGKGIFFLVKVENLTQENFELVLEYLRNDIFKDIPTDNKAKGIARNFFIPLDENLYTNDNAIFIVKSEKLYRVKKSAIVGIKQERDIKKHDIHISAPFTPYIPIDKLFQSILFQPYVETNGEPVINQPVQFIKCFIPRKIKDDFKHTIFSAITNVLVHLNPNLPLIYFKSFIWWVNQNYTCGTPMLRKEMEAVVTYAYNDSKSNGLWQTNKKWVRTKWVHFDKYCGYSPPRKMEIAREITSKRKVGETTKIIETAIAELKQSGIEPTQAKVICKLNGIRCARTIKKYWKKIMPKVEKPEATAAIRKIQLMEPLKVTRYHVNRE